MVILETLVVASSIAAIISGFKDAKSLFEKWRKRRKSKSSSHDDESRFEQSLKHNPNKVSTAYECGFRSLGNKFAKGDDVSHRSLMRTLLQFNKTLVECLKVTLSLNSDPDLSSWWRSSESVGREVLFALRDLCQRLQVANPIPRAPNTKDKQDKQPCLTEIRNYATSTAAVKNSGTSSAVVRRPMCLAMPSWAIISIPTEAPLPHLDTMDYSSQLRRDLESYRSRVPSCLDIPVSQTSYDGFQSLVRDLAEVSVPRNTAYASSGSAEVLAGNVSELQFKSQHSITENGSRMNSYSRATKSSSDTLRRNLDVLHQSCVERDIGQLSPRCHSRRKSWVREWIADIRSDTELAQSLPELDFSVSNLDLSEVQSSLSPYLIARQDGAVQSPQLAPTAGNGGHYMSGALPTAAKSQLPRQSIPLLAQHLPESDFSVSNLDLSEAQSSLSPYPIARQDGALQSPQLAPVAGNGGYYMSRALPTAAKSQLPRQSVPLLAQLLPESDFGVSNLDLSEAQSSLSPYPITRLDRAVRSPQLTPMAGNDGHYMSGALPTAAKSQLPRQSVPPLHLRGGGMKSPVSRTRASEFRAASSPKGNPFCTTALRLQSDTATALYPMLRGSNLSYQLCRACQFHVDTSPVTITISGNQQLTISGRYLAKHHTIPCTSTAVKMATFLCGLCDSSCRSRNDFILHLEAKHGNEVDAQKLCADEDMWLGSGS